MVFIDKVSCYACFAITGVKTILAIVSASIANALGHIISHITHLAEGRWYTRQAVALARVARCIGKKESTLTIYASFVICAWDTVALTYRAVSIDVHEVVCRAYLACHCSITRRSTGQTIWRTFLTNLFRSVESKPNSAVVTLIIVAAVKTEICAGLACPILRIHVISDDAVHTLGLVAGAGFRTAVTVRRTAHTSLTGWFEIVCGRTCYTILLVDALRALSGTGITWIVLVEVEAYRTDAADSARLTLYTIGSTCLGCSMG